VFTFGNSTYSFVAPPAGARIEISGGKEILPLMIFSPAGITGLCLKAGDFGKFF
jgi:hypothetical protein